MKFIGSLLIATGCWMAFLFSCKNKQTAPFSTGNDTATTQPAASHSNQTKPPSNYFDTLIIDKIAAVFYHPDSLQLKKIETLTDKGIHESIMHEYFYQMRNSKIVLKKNWPAVRIIEAKNIRYLLFKKQNSETVLIDLDLKNDSYGLFLFNPSKDPHFTDMMNIDTELPRYFSK